MNAKLKDIVQRVETWPDAALDELTQIVLEIDARLGGVYHATPDELRAIDRGLREADAGQFATDEEVEATFAKYRRA